MAVCPLQRALVADGLPAREADQPKGVRRVSATDLARVRWFKLYDNSLAVKAAGYGLDSRCLFRHGFTSFRVQKVWRLVAGPGHVRPQDTRLEKPYQLI